MSAMAAAVDAWTMVHHLYGAYFFSVCGMGLGETMMMALAWEVFESTPVGIAVWQDSGYEGNSWRNAVVDIAATCSGWLLAAMRH